jgi:hypothetical protein
MSNFGENKTTSQTFHENQTSHYGIQNGAVPQMNSSSQNIKTIPRKPVGSGSTQPQSGPYPAVPTSSAPARKPVGGDRTKPSASTTKTQQKSSARSGAPNLDKALPRIPNNAIPPFIPRDTTGRFDQRHKTPEGHPPQAPVGYTERFDMPHLAQTQLNSLASPLPAPRNASRPTTPRPDSKGMPIVERKRTNSGMSGFFSTPPGSRRASLADTAKNVGKWAKSKADILTMNQAQRDSFVKGATRSRDVEAARRADPSTRPAHQKEMLVEKQKASHPGEAWGLGPVDAAFDAQMEERNFRSRTAKEYRKRHDQDCATAILEGKPRPLTPDAAKYTPPAGSLTSEERDAELQFDPESEPSTLTTTEKFALGISRKLDAFKSGRKDSDCSDMDFGMTDAAPAGAIQFCGEMAGTPFHNKGCHMPSRSHLKNGLCEACYEYRKNGGQ